MAARLAWVTLAVSGPASSQVLLDGAVVPPAAQGVRLACNPGAHTVKVSAEGFAGAQQSFAIGEEGNERCHLTLQALAPAPWSRRRRGADRAAPTETSPVIPERTSTFHATAGWTALGLGVVGLGVGGATGVLALDRHASLRDSHFALVGAAHRNTLRRLIAIGRWRTSRRSPPWSARPPPLRA